MLLHRVNSIVKGLLHSRMRGYIYCGNTFTVRSNKAELHLETCNKCHPFYTGEQGSATRTGRVEKFNRKYGFDKKAA